MKTQLIEHISKVYQKYHAYDHNDYEVFVKQLKGLSFKELDTILLTLLKTKKSA